MTQAQSAYSPQAILLRRRQEIARRVIVSYLTLIRHAINQPNPAAALNGLAPLPDEAVFAPWSNLAVRLGAAASTAHLSRESAIAVAQQDKLLVEAAEADRQLAIDSLAVPPSDQEFSNATALLGHFQAIKASPDAGRLQAMAEMVGDAWAATILGDPRATEHYERVKNTASLIGSGTEAVIPATTPIIASVVQRLSRAAKPCERFEGLRPRAERGYWGRWLAAYMSDQAAMLPGRNLLLGAASGAGKTSTTAVLADDAIADGCAVRWGQLELPFDEVLSHMIAQHLPYDYGTTQTRGTTPTASIASERGVDIRAQELLGDQDVQRWNDLLSYDSTPIVDRRDYRHLMAEMTRFAEHVKMLRDKGIHTHACNGLFIIDYVQRLRDPALHSQQSSPEAISGACSALQEHAYNLGMSLILLSQMNKSSQKEGVSGDPMAFKGIDVNFADTAFSLQIVATKPGTSSQSRNNTAPVPGLGDVRLVTNIKSRGRCPDIVDPTSDYGTISPSSYLFIQNRMVHGAWAYDEARDRMAKLIGGDLDDGDGDAPVATGSPQRTKGKPQSGGPIAPPKVPTLDRSVLDDVPPLEVRM